MRVIGCKLPVYPAQVEHGVDLSNQMIWRNHLIQIKRIKELTLPDFPPTHHEPPPRIIAHRRNHGSLIVSTRVLQQNRGQSGQHLLAVSLSAYDPNRKLATQCATPPMTRGREEFGREVYHAYGRRVTMLVPLWRRNGKIV